MGLQQLCTQIEQNSKVRAASILKEAKADAKRIEQLAKKNADEALATAAQSAQKFSDLEAKERLNAAQLEASKLISDAKDEAVNRCLEQVWEHFSQTPKKSGYRQKLREWATAALEDLSLPGAIIRCRASDKSTLGSMGFKTAESIDCYGGLRAEAKGGRVIVDYTLQAQFESKKEELTKKIYDALFSADDYVEPEQQKSSKKKKRG